NSLAVDDRCRSGLNFNDENKMRLILQIQILVTLFAVASLRAASISGEITLKEIGEFNGTASFKKQFGDVVKATTDWRVGDFFGEETIFAGVTVKNTGSRP